MRSLPFTTTLKPYGKALVDIARRRPEILCLSGDLTRQCEIDIFQEEFPERFIHAGMAEANMMSMAGALARRGHMPFVHTFGVFATRRPLDQIVNSIAYPRLPVRIVGFMPGVSSPGGPNHQAIDDVALMRALPNMTVIDVADAVEIRSVVPQLVDICGPVYLRLKRGDIPLIFEDDHRVDLDAAQVIEDGKDVVLVASGMMVAAAIEAAAVLRDHGVDVGLINVPVIKPFDAATVVAAVRTARCVITAENHSIIGGLGSAVAEALAEAGSGVPLQRIGLADTFAEGSRDAPFLFRKYGLATQDIIDVAWGRVRPSSEAPRAAVRAAGAGEYAPV